MDRPTDPRLSRRVIVLGASNVMRSLGHVVDEARAAWGSPLDLLVASGYGRSYGTPSRVLRRTLPSLLECGVWRALDAGAPAPTAALITDVGNDILYGAPVDRIVEWVTACAERLRPQVDRLVITRLPLEGIDALGEFRYRLVRTLLFPSTSVTLDAAREAARVVDERLAVLAERLGAHLVGPDPTWYGLDPVHVRRGRRREAWRTILDPWSVDDGRIASPRRLSALGRLRLRMLLPEHRWFFGVEQRRRQPARILPDGSRLSLY